MNWRLVCRILAAALFSGLLVGCQKSAKLPESEPVRAIKYTEIKAQSGNQQRQLSGYIRAADQSNLSFQVSGQVQSITVKVGETVKAGQLLAQVDPQAYRLRLRQAEAELASARVELKEREDNFERQQQVYRKQFISQNTLERAEADYHKARSAVQLAESKLSLAERDLRLTKLKAPFSGVITRIEIEAFEEVGSHQAVMEIQGKDALEVEFLVPATLLKAIKQGLEVGLLVPAVGDRRFKAVIIEQGASRDLRGAFPVRATVQTPDGALYAGMSAEVLLPVGQADPVIRLPESAVVVADNGKEQVYVYDRSTGQVKPREVKTRLMDSNTVQVLEGLAEGDIVCIAGAEFLRAGQVVSLYQPKAGVATL